MPDPARCSVRPPRYVLRPDGDRSIRCRHDPGRPRRLAPPARARRGTSPRSRRGLVHVQGALGRGAPAERRLLPPPCPVTAPADRDDTEDVRREEPGTRPGASASVRITDATGSVARRRPGAPASRDRQPADGTASAARTRPLGRDSAQAGRRARRNARSIATSASRRRRGTETAPCSSPTSSSTCPAESTSSSTRRRRSPPTSIRSRPTTSGRARRTSRYTLARCVTTSASSAPSATGNSSSPRPSS